MIIRKAKQKDLFQILDLVILAKAISPYKDIPSDKDAMSGVVRRLISNGLSCVLVAELDRKLHGIVMGEAVELWYSNSKRCADPAIFYCIDESAGSDLIREYLRWAWSIKSVAEVTFSVASQYDPTLKEDTFDSAGLSESGQTWIAVRPQEQDYGIA